MQARPENVGKRWTPAEESQILSKSATGVPIKAIAEQHGRTICGVRMRLLLIATTFVSEGKTVSEAARLTGLNASRIIAQIQMSEKTDSDSAAPVPSPKMQFSHTLSRADLQAIPAKRRLDAIQRYVDHHVGLNVQHAAAAGETNYLFVIPKVASMGKSYPPAYEVTPYDIVEGLKAKYPGCDVEFGEEWVETRPGVRVHRSGIKIDWS
jgi:hypothetical protein